jgi:cytochrome c-type biogenesis protein CcmF
MIVHLGVVIVAVALAAATSYGQRTQLVLKAGQSVRYDGHVFTYVGTKQFSLPNKAGEIATVLVDRAPFHPAISVFPGSEGIGTPAVDSSVREDTYLTLADVSLSGAGSATIDVVIQPMVMWLWVGGIVTAFGAVLAAIPSRRRRGSGARRGLYEQSETSAGPQPGGPGSRSAGTPQDMVRGASGEQPPARVGAGTGL